MANRLRLIQSDAASAAPKARRDLLHEEVSRSLKDIPAASRKGYLEALLARFPVAGQLAKSAPAALPVATPVPVDETAERVLERFLAAAAKLSEEKRAELAKRLSEAGLTWVDRSALVLEISDELRPKLGLQADQQPRLTRVVELAVFLVEALCRVDENALKAMRELAPRSPLLKRPEDFRRTAARFLTSENESLEPQWRTIRGLLGALLAAMLGGGKDFGKDYVERLSPAAIEDVVVSEGGGGLLFGPNKKERCWDKYKDLVGDYATSDLINHRIRDCLAAFVEKTLLGAR